VSDRSLRHRFDPAMLLVGAYFLAVAGVFLSSALGHGPRLPFPATAIVVVAGIVLVKVVSVLTRSRRRRPR
jgi:hypothetical protein